MERNLQGGLALQSEYIEAPTTTNCFTVHTRKMCSGRVPPEKLVQAAYWHKILVDLVPLPRKMGRRVRESWSAHCFIESACRTVFHMRT